MSKAHELQRAAAGFPGVIAVCVVAGLAFLGIGIATRSVGFGIFGLAIMVGYAVFLTLLRRRAEPIALLAGEVQDERQRRVMEHALAFTANVLVLVLVGGFMVSLAVGSELTEVFSALSAVAGISLVIGLVYYSRRS